MWRITRWWNLKIYKTLNLNISNIKKKKSVPTEYAYILYAYWKFLKAVMLWTQEKYNSIGIYKKRKTAIRKRKRAIIIWSRVREWSNPLQYNL